MEPTLKNIMAFFEMSPSDFSKEWKKLTPEDKEQIKHGLMTNTYTY